MRYLRGKLLCLFIDVDGFAHHTQVLIFALSRCVYVQTIGRQSLLVQEVQFVSTFRRPLLDKGANIKSMQNTLVKPHTLAVSFDLLN